MVYHIGIDNQVERWSTDGDDFDGEYKNIKKESYDFQLPTTYYPELAILNDTEIEYCRAKYSAQVDRVSTFITNLFINFSSNFKKKLKV